MTHKTRLQKHARKTQLKKALAAETGTKLSVAASVAIASTIALAPIAQAEPLSASQPQTQETSSPTPKPAALPGGDSGAANTAGQGTPNSAGQGVANSANTASTPHQPTPATMDSSAENNADPNAESVSVQESSASNKPQVAVITPNNENQSATTQEEANRQVKREEDNTKTYTFTVSYCVEGYHQKQLRQPSEYTFTDKELTKITNDGLYLPIPLTNGYRAQRGAYIKQNDGYVKDTKKNDSIQSYMKIDRELIEKNINLTASTETHKVSNYVIEYRPKTITYYVRHMLQDSNDQQKFKEYNGAGDKISVPDENGNKHDIWASKAKGVVGQNLYAQPITIPGYHPEPNLINSPIPDDADYEDNDSNGNEQTPKKRLVLELRYLLNKHNVSYDTQGGTAIQSKVFSYGMTVDAVPDPARKGYKFLGWTKELGSLETRKEHAQENTSKTPSKDPSATRIDSMPDSDVHFVAHWEANKEAQYNIGIWVQKADLVDPKHPENMDNYDFIGMVTRHGNSDTDIKDTDLTLTQTEITNLAWPDQKLRGAITNKDDFNKYFMEDQASEARTKALNDVEEPEYFGAKKMRPLTKIRPDGTTVVNKVFNRRVYELIFANPDIEKDGTTNKLFDAVNHFTITKDGKEYDDSDKSKLYKVTYRFGQTIHYTSGFPADTETKRYQTEDDSTPLYGLGWRVANDAGKVFFIDTPPYRFDEKHFIAPEIEHTSFSQDKIRLFGEKLTPYQRVLVPDANSGQAGPIHVLVKLETEESARRNDDNDRQYVASELSYTKDDTLNNSYDYEAPTIEGFEAVNKTQKIEEKPNENDYYDKLAEELADIWEKDHPDGEQPDDDDDEFKNWVAQKFPHLVFTKEGSNGAELEKNGLLTFEYKRKKAPVRFAVDEVTPIQDTQGDHASTQEPFGTNIKKFATDYNNAVKKVDPAEGKQFASSYTFTIGDKTYTFKRPDSLPEDYEFAGWSLDPAGTNKLAVTNAAGEAYTAQEIADLLKDKKSPEEIAKVLGNIPLETGGITLYASWKRVDTVHTIDVDMNREDAPVHTQVKVTHGEYAKTPSEKVQDGSDPSSQGCFPKPSPRPGYMFTGWLQKYTGTDGTEQWLPFAFTSPILENLKIKAQWIEDKRVKGTVSHIFLRPGYTVDQYKQAKTDNNTELLKKMVADEQVVTLSNLRPRSSYAAEAAYRNDNYYPDHTYSTFVVSDNKANNHAEFIYTPYATRRYTVYFKDKAGHELAAPEVFVSNKLSYDVAHAKVIPGYRLPNDTPLARQLNFTDARNTAYIKPDANGNYSVEFIYDDVRVLARNGANAPQPNAYSRVQFNTETSELTMQDGKVITTTSTTDGGALAAFNGTTTGDKTHPLQQLIFDVVKGTKAYEMPLPVPHAREGYTFTGWTSQVVFKAGEKAAEGANRLPVFSEEFPYQVIYTAHFKKTKIQFKDTDPKAQPPEGYYKVTYTADQNGRLKRTVPNEQGGTKDEILDTLTNVVVLDKYKDNVIDAPVAVPDKGFEATEGFSFEGKDEKDRTYTKHFEMIEPTAVAKRYVLPGHTLLQPGQTARDLVDNHDAYADTDDATTGAQAATYEFCDEKGNAATLDDTTVGEHKVFIKVTAGREHSRVYKIVPFFYEVLPEMSFGEEFNAHGYTDDITGHYKKITFRSNANEGELIGKDRTKSVDDNKTLETYVYTGESASGNYKLDMPSAVGNDYHDDGYHYVFRGWRKVGAHAQTTPVNDFKTFKADIAAKERYHTIEKPKQDVVYEAVYEKIPYIVTKVTDGTIPEDSVVVSFKPAPGRKWADGSTGPKVLYIKKGMDISRLDEHGVPIKDGDHTTKSILQVLGEKLDGYASDWTKSSMDGITLIKSMKTGAGADGWKSNNAFQEFVAHQTPYVEPEAVSEFTIAQNGTVPTPEEFVKNLAQLKGNNIAKDDQGKPIFKIETIGQMPTSKVAATYTIPWTVTLKHADMSDTITYKCTTVLRVMGNVYNATDAKTMIDSIAASETPDTTTGKSTPLTPAQEQFKKSYARVVFDSDDKGTLSGGDTDTTLTRYVKTNTDINLSIPGVNPHQKLDDHDGKGEYDYLFDHWEIQVNPTGESAGASNGEARHAAAYKRGKRSVDVFPQTMLFAAHGAGADAPTEGNTIVAGATNETLAASLRRLKRQFAETYPQATYVIIARYKKVYYVTPAKDVNSIPAGFVPVVAFPAPGHTWEDGSVDPDIYYVKSGESYGDKRKSWEKGLANLRGWKYLGASGKQITDPAALATIDRPTKALTLIAEQYDLPELKPKNDLVITEGDLMPSYNEMVQDTPQINPETGQLLLEPNSQNPAMINGVEAFSTLKLNPRFAGWETDRDSYAKLSTDKPGIYRVRFGLKYYTDEQELDPQTKQPLHENGKIKHKVAIKWVEANVHILPRVIAEQDLPADDTREAQFMKANYTKVTYRVALGDHGFLASPNTTFYVRRGYTIDPNALLNFDKDKRAKRLQEMQKHVVDEKQLKQEIGVPSAIAQPGYVFYEWQKHAANDQGDVVYLAHFHKLPITHFEFETSTEAEQSFSTRLIGDAQNYPTYKPKAGTTLPEGVTVTCKGDTCTVSGTPHITDWTNGETQRTIELTFEAVDTRDPDKYGRSSYGIQKEIIVRIVVKRPHPTTGGSHGGGSYGGGSYGGGESIPWTELTPAVEAPATPAPTPTPAEAPAPAPARPRVRAARHARLPQTGDSQLAATAAEILGMGAGMISLVAGARKKKRKHEDKGNENKN